MFHPLYVEIEFMDDYADVYDSPANIELVNDGVKITTTEKKYGATTVTYEFIPNHRIKRVTYGQVSACGN